MGVGVDCAWTVLWVCVLTVPGLCCGCKGKGMFLYSAVSGP